MSIGVLKSICVDFSDESLYQYITVFSEEIYSRTIEITPLNNGEEYTIPTGTIARLEARKPDNKPILLDSKIDFTSNKLYIELTPKCLDTPGVTSCQIGLYGVDNRFIASSYFYIDVYRSALSGNGSVNHPGCNSNVVESSPEYQSFRVALLSVDEVQKRANAAILKAENDISNAIQNMDVEIDDAVNKVEESAEEAIENVKETNESVSKNELERKENEAKRQQNEQLRDAAEEDRKKDFEAMVTDFGNLGGIAVSNEEPESERVVAWIDPSDDEKTLFMTSDDIAQELGDDPNKVLSQKAATEHLDLQIDMGEEFEGYYVMKDGTLSPFDGFSCSDYIDIHSFANKKIKVKCSFIMSAGAAIYDELYNTIVGYIGNDVGDITELEITLPENAYYIRVSSRQEVFPFGNCRIELCETAKTLFQLIQDNAGTENTVEFVKGNGIVGYYLDLLGNEVAFDTFTCSDFINVSRYKGFTLQCLCTIHSSAAICFYDRNKNFVGALTSTDVGNHRYIKASVTIPDNAHYVRYSVLHDEVPFEDSEIKVILAHKEEYPFDIDIGTFIDGKYIAGSNGAFLNFNGFCCTDFVSVNGFQGDKIRISCRIDDSAGFAFYNSEKQFISGMYEEVNGTYGEGISTIETTVPENAEYIRITGTAGDSPVLYPLICYKHRIDMLKNSVFNAQEIDNIKKKGLGWEFWKHLQMNVICIGDSLTQGAYYSPAYNGSSIGENYPYFLQKLTGWNVTNSGLSGRAPKSWYNEKFATHDFSTFDTAIIWLGTNKGLTDTIEADTVSGNSETYADTETGYYCKILDGIIAQNPNIRIFLGTIFACSGDLATTNIVISKLAKRYNTNVVGVVENNDGKLFANSMQDILHPFNNTVHFGKVGNLYLAQHWVTGITDIMNDNLTKFEILLK